MTLWVCDTCGTKYAVGLFTCPRCKSTSFHEEGRMPKITRHGGATNAELNPPDDAAPEPEPEADDGSREAPATDGPPREGVDVPADGSTHEIELEGDDTGEALPPIDDGDQADTEPVETGQDDGPTDVAEPTDDDEPAPARPNVNDPKAAWVDYAVWMGMERASAEQCSKRSLIDVTAAVESGSHVINDDGQVIEAP